MALNTIILMRHAERLDRAMEAQGENWISTAPRPQDPPLSPAGRLQAQNVGRQLRESNFPIQKILCSPLIRCVQTADIVAQELGLGGGTLCVEPGLIEESKSMRGRSPPDPPPTWDPLYLSAIDLQAFSPRINDSYSPLIEVFHAKNESFYNHVQELLPHPLNDELDRDEVTRLRCRSFVSALTLIPDEECILCVGHGASVLGCATALQDGLSSEKLIKGDRRLNCYAAFNRCESSERSSWYAPSGAWSYGDVACVDTCDNTDDRG